MGGVPSEGPVSLGPAASPPSQLAPSPADLAAVVKAEAERIEHDPDCDEWEEIASPDDLAEAVRAIRSGSIPLSDMREYAANLKLLMAEYDRRGVVEQAARTLVEDLRSVSQTVFYRRLDVLEAVVNGEQP